MIENGRGLLDEKGLEDVAIATGEGILWQQGKGCYRVRRWLLWRWEVVAMVIRKGCYGNLVTVAMVICLVAMVT